jgi:hypothetical protein
LFVIIARFFWFVRIGLALGVDTSLEGETSDFLFLVGLRMKSSIAFAADSSICKIIEEKNLTIFISSVLPTNVF